MTDLYDIISSEDLEKTIECEEVKIEEMEEALKIGEKLIRTSVALGGMGLAAPQVGISKKIFVFAFYDEEEMFYQIAINPSYFPSEKKITKVVEGCLSYKDTYIVDRFKYIRAIYYTYKGNKLNKITKNLRGEQAIVFQHETDHLYNKHIGLIGSIIKN